MTESSNNLNWFTEHCHEVRQIEKFCIGPGIPAIVQTCDKIHSIVYNEFYKDLYHFMRLPYNALKRSRMVLSV